MRKLTIITLALLAVFALTAILAFAEESKKDEKCEYTYVGAEKCAKSCHKAQFASWGETAHAKGFTKLSAEDQKKPECVGCHISGKLADGTVLEGVQCEACHGPGSAYKSIKIMNQKWKADPETYKKKAIDAGLIYPTEEDCKKCHRKEGNPNFKEFDFEASKGKVHTMNAE